MNEVLRVSFAASLVLSIAISAVDAEESCRGLKQIGSAPMETMPDGTVYSPVAIGDHSLNFQLNMENQGSFISASAATALELPREHITDWDVNLDGDRLHEFATANAMKFGGLTGKVRFIVAPDSDFVPTLSGALGADFLRNFDVDFDFAKGRINVFSPDHCEGGVVYWTQSGASRVPMKVDSWGQIRVDAELDGKSVPAELATGLPKSLLVMSEDEAKFGVQGKDWKLVRSGGSRYGSSPTIYEHVFKSLTISGIQVSNVDLTIRSGSTPYWGAGLLLGMDILRQLHLYVAYKERNLYVSAASATAAPLPKTAEQPASPPAH